MRARRGSSVFGLRLGTREILLARTPLCCSGYAGGVDELGSAPHSTSSFEKEEALSEEEKKKRLQALEDLIELMRPAVQGDGGDLVLVDADVEAGVVEVMLEGACSSCAISSSTLQAGIERVLRQRLPWIREVRGGVDENVDFWESFAAGQGGYIPRF